MISAVLQHPHFDAFEDFIAVGHFDKFQYWPVKKKREKKKRYAYTKQMIRPAAHIKAASWAVSASNHKLNIVNACLSTFFFFFEFRVSNCPCAVLVNKMLQTHQSLKEKWKKKPYIEPLYLVFIFWRMPEQSYVWGEMSKIRYGFRTSKWALAAPWNGDFASSNMRKFWSGLWC